MRIIVKKIFAITAALAICLTFTSCGNKNSLPEDTSAIEQYIERASETVQAEVTATSETTVTTAETTAVTTVETTVPTETAADEQEYMTGETSLLYFLDYLQNGAKHDIILNFHLNITLNYDFMDDFKINSYSYEHRGDGIYDVKLTCSDSTCDIFPNGDSYWYANTDRRGNFYFCPAERENEVMLSTEYPMPLEKPAYTAYSAAANFTLATGAFEADKEWFESYTDINVHSFYHAYNPYMEKDELTGGVYPEEQIRAVKLLYNIDIPIESFDYLSERGLVDDGKVFSYCGHGASWYYDTFAGYDETENEVKVRVNYYGDSIYFYPVIQSEYTFSKNADGSITLQKVEKVFDRGYDPEWDSV